MPWFLMELHPARPSFPADASPAESQIVAAHFTRLADIEAQGRLALVGRTQEPARPLGLCLFEADSQEDADRFVAADPAVTAGLFIGRARRFAMVLGTEDAWRRARAAEDR